MSAERDALAFFETLYRGRPEPSVIALSFKRPGGGLHTRYALTAANAAEMVLGSIDCWHRLSLLAHRPESGRGSEADSIAVPGMALDLDVNGSPDGKGGVVTGAFESVEAAVELASSVLEPTMIVRSGYGIQPYYLTKEMLALGSNGDRDRAKLLGQRLHARFQQDAAELGVLKIDSVFDLARLLRPPGSANGKGRQPQPVQLLDDGDRRYTLDELLAAGVDVEAGFTADEEADDRPPRSVEELLAVGKLGRIARHEGTPPKDSSDSGWDNYMACEAVRQGLSEAEFGLLLRFARHDDKKSRDEGYGRRTWAHARDEVGAEERPGQTSGSAAEAITERYGLQARPGRVGQLDRRRGRGNAIMYLHRREGARLRIEQLGDLFTATSHNRVIERRHALAVQGADAKRGCRVHAADHRAVRRRGRRPVRRSVAVGHGLPEL